MTPEDYYYLEDTRPFVELSDIELQMRIDSHVCGPFCELCYEYDERYKEETEDNRVDEVWEETSE